MPNSRKDQRKFGGKTAPGHQKISMNQGKSNVAEPNRNDKKD